MKKRIVPFVLFLILIIIIAGFAIHNYLTPDTLFNNAPVSGNTAGNLYNSGLFCESDGKIFFANPSDDYKLYSMNTDGSELKKMSDDIATYINADSHYVYYVCNNPRNTSDALGFLSINPDVLCRIDRDGRQSSILTLDTAPCLYASLVGDYVYYLHYDKGSATTLYRVKIDGSGQEQVDSSPYFTCSVNQYDIYYNGLEGDHNIWKMNTVTKARDLVFTGNCWMPTVANNGSTVYYMDCDDNYKLTRADITSSVSATLTTLSQDRIDCYNYYDGYLYFQRNDTKEPALCRMLSDGTNYMVIAEGNYTDINITSDYVYYRDFQSGMMYRTPTEAPVTSEIFNPGTAN